MKAKANILGACSVYQEQIDSSLENLNKSMNIILKEKKELSFIKEITFSFNDEIEPNLCAQIKLRSGETKTASFLSNYIKEDIYQHHSYISSFYGEAKLDLVKKFLDGEELNYEYLSVYELDLTKQLIQLSLLKASPNILEGHEFTDKTLNFFLSLK